MHAFRKLTTLLIASVFILSTRHTALGEDEDPAIRRQQAIAKQAAGNFQDAFNLFKRNVLDQNNNTDQIKQDISRAARCLSRLNKVYEIDELLPAAVELHKDNPHVLIGAASALMQTQHFGTVVAGEFRRGRNRGDTGKFVNTNERDRVLALQYLERVFAIQGQLNQSQRIEFLTAFAKLVMLNRQGADSWRLQTSTDLKTLPDFEENGAYGFRFGHGGSGSSGAPVDEDGNPVLYSTPESWAAAKSDGERWRWLLSEAVRIDPKQRMRVNFEFAQFLQQQFGVQTMGHYRSQLAVDPETGEPKADSRWTVHTLKNNESIARLATGIKRFELPNEYQFITILQNIFDSPNANDPSQKAQGERAGNLLVEVFQNRRQYKAAANALEKMIARFGAGPGNGFRERLNQIRGNWGQFEATKPQLAGGRSSLDFRFRNSTQVVCEAFPINVTQLLADTKNYLRSRPQRLDRRQINLSNIGYRLVTENQTRYLRPRIAQWQLKLEPGDNHFDRRVTINTPLQTPGAYLVTAKVPNGNTSRVVLWVEDTVIARKQMAQGSYYFVADAKTGAPVPNANIEFFGYRQKRAGRNQFQVDVQNFAANTDANGQAILSAAQLDSNFQWVAMARKDQRMAWIGFDRIWYPRNQPDDAYADRYRTYAVTDRPVYRPGKTVQYKFWLRNARFDANGSRFANAAVTLRIRDPKNTVVKEQQVTTDEWGGVAGEFAIPADATLGSWSLELGHLKPRVRGRIAFRVEEYRKPEYEVTVKSSDKPVRLGEKIPVTIQANYFFGAPVTEGRIKYKVERTGETTEWYPRGPWDWLYGRGYSWFAVDHEWYPGWKMWGCIAPSPPWWGGRNNPPETVLEGEADIAPDGELRLEIDTVLAKELHSDQDHRYRITAEVTDESRRTIVGNGSVLVSRQPFQTVVWTNRGHYQTNDTVVVTVNSHTPDNKPILGTGDLKLFRISYDDTGKPQETEVSRAELALNERGESSTKLVARQSGQYRLSCDVTDESGQTVSGGYVFSVRGPDDDGSNYRFNDLELIADKSEYKAGDVVQLLVNTNHTNSTVALFLRPADGRYSAPKMLRRAGKSSLWEIPIERRDMPNFFVEALTVVNGKVHTQVREIIVPPVSRVANIQVIPSQKTYEPGDAAEMQLKLKDENGQPFRGSAVVAVYDKSVEAIGGTGPGDIREFFWKFRRRHRPSTRDNLQKQSRMLVKRNEKTMRPIGVFGGMVQRRGYGMEMAADSMVMESMVAAPPPMALAGAKLAPGGSAKPVVARSKFADTAFWSANVKPDANGIAKLNFKLPDNLTTWKIRTWAVGSGTRVGEASTEIIVSKKLLVRMQAPRFFVERDQVMLSANVHNYLNESADVDVALGLDGNSLAVDSSTPLTRKLMIPSGAEKRVDWVVNVTQPGTAKIRMQALSDSASDAIEKSFPVSVHGILRTESWTRAIRDNNNSAIVDIDVPADRRAESTRLEIRYSPSVALAMVDALPYLVSAPEKTTDSVLNRFLPTVLVHKVLQELNLDLEAIQKKRTNLNSQEIGDAQQRAADWHRQTKHLQDNPVFDTKRVEQLTQTNLRELYKMQLTDGGWGWYSGYGEFSTPHMTCLAVQGLTTARQNGVAIVPDVLQRGEQWLKRHQMKQIQLLQAYEKFEQENDGDKTPVGRRPAMKRFATNSDALVFKTLSALGQHDATMETYLYRDRTRLSVYGMTLVALALEGRKESAERTDMLLENIGQFVERKPDSDTAWLRLPRNGWWFWFGDEIEATSHYLMLISKRDPKLASQIARYLINNRKHATYWRSTRDTAAAIVALATYVRESNETQPDMTVQVVIDGDVKKEVRINSDNLFSFDNAFVMTGDALSAGRHSVELRRQGTGPLYFSAYLTNFSKGDNLKNAGLELKVNRRYFKLVPDKNATAQVAGDRGQALSQRVQKFTRQEITNGTTIQSGDLVEVELLFETANDYEYLIFEDRKPSGFEPVDQRSGYTRSGVRAYRQFRDDRVSFSVPRLVRGSHSISYRIRAEAPGQFSALPTMARAMYAPELRGNSDELTLKVVDSSPTEE